MIKIGHQLCPMSRADFVVITFVIRSLDKAQSAFKNRMNNVKLQMMTSVSKGL
jgi:hypothetical protein